MRRLVRSMSRCATAGLRTDLTHTSGVSMVDTVLHNAVEVKRHGMSPPGGLGMVLRDVLESVGSTAAFHGRIQVGTKEASSPLFLTLDGNARFLLMSHGMPEGLNTELSGLCEEQHAAIQSATEDQDCFIIDATIDL